MYLDYVKEVEKLPWAGRNGKHFNENTVLVLFMIVRK